MFGGTLFGRPTFGGDLPPRFALPYAFPNFAGVKFREVNLVPRPTDSGNGSNDPTPTPAYFYDLMYDIGVNGSSDVGWTHWLKPQIDAMRAINVNCVRIILDPTARAGDASHNGPATWRGSLTAPQFAAFLDLLFDYCASLGMYVYPSGAEPWAMDNLTEAQLLAYFQEFASVCSDPQYTNVIGLDVLQEFDRSTYVTSDARLGLIMGAARAGLQKSMPLTCSVATYTNWATAVPRAAAAGVDFLDLHSYLYQTPLWLTYLIPNAWRLPVIVAETGVGYNGGYFEPGNAQEVTHPYSSQRRARHYQDFVSGLGNRFDMQLTGVFGATKEWPADNQDWGLFSDAQDGSYNFTTQRTEVTGPFALIPKVPQPYTSTHTLDLTGADTVIAAYSSQTTYMLGWSQADISNRFNRSTNRVHRVTGAFTTGVVSYWGLPSFNQSVSVDFNAAQAVASGGEIDWAVSVRHQGETDATLAPTTFYFANVVSKPGTPAQDGMLSIWSVVGGVTFVKLVDVAALQPFDLTHSYRLTLTATGTYPTVLTAVVRDLTTDTQLVSSTVENSNASIQGRGVPGLPATVGEVYYTNVIYQYTNDAGPSLTVPTVTPVSSTAFDLSWSAATGGFTPYTYIPQYVAVDSYGFPTATWTSSAPQTGTTLSVTGVTGGVDYAVRILVIDSRPLRALTYSAWSLRDAGGFLPAWARGSNVMLGAWAA